MNNIRRWKFVIIITAVLCILGASFLWIIMGNHKQNDNFDMKENTTIRILNNWGSGGLKEAVMMELLNEYMQANEDVHIICESIKGNRFYIKMLTDFASGNSPDILIMKPTPDVEQLFEKGKLISFNEELEADGRWYDTLDKSLIRYVNTDKGIYGIPTDIEYICMFINRDLFDKYGIAVPKKYSELKNTVLQFKERGVIPIAFAGKDEDMLLYQSLISVLGGSLEIEKAIEDGKPGKCYVEAFEYMEELYKMGAFGSDCIERSRNDAAKMFEEKRAAILIESSDYISDIERKKWEKVYISDKSVEIAPFPQIENNNSIYTLPIGAGDSTYYISKGASEKSMEIVKYLSSPEATDRFTEDAKAMMRVNTATAQLYDTGLFAGRELLLTNAGELTQRPANIFTREILDKYIIKNVGNILMGKISADEVIKNAAENME